MRKSKEAERQYQHDYYIRNKELNNFKVLNEIERLAFLKYRLSGKKSMNTFMPIMLTFTFVIIPIPAGVLLYLIASNCFQVLQTVIINKQLEVEDAKKANKIDDDDVANAKRIQEK